MYYSHLYKLTTVSPHVSKYLQVMLNCMASVLFLATQPLGILAILDEECLFPKANDKSYVEKLHKNHDGKSPNYIKPSFKPKGTTVHFEVAHYAGTVSALDPMCGLL